ncbi:MAG: hypothetical protein E7444_07035 [Ruminococcaceae bacterium]|nr:hypothetical protein [Oscillospiraceae bacterium]
MSGKETRGSAELALKAGFWYVVSNFFVKAISFITTPLFARLMSAEHYGEFSNYASWQSTLFLISGAELYGTLNRAYYDYTEDYDKYVSSITFLSFGITALFYAVFLLFGDAIYKIVLIPKQYVHVLFVFLLFQSCKEIFMAREKTLYRYKSVAAMSAINLVFPTIVAVVMVIMADEANRLSARIYGFYIPSAIVGIFCAVAILRKAHTVNFGHCKYALKLSLPLTLHFLTAYLLSSSNTIVTRSILNAEATAIVSITTSAVHILTILLQAVSGAVTTWMMDNLEQKRYTELRRSLLIYTVCVCAVATGVILFGPEVVWILGGTKYAQAVDLLPGMIAAVTIQSITTVFTIILTYKKRVVGAAVCTAVVAGISIAAKVFLLPSYGIRILPLINIVAYGILFICDYILVCRAGNGNVIHIGGFSGCILLLCVLTSVCGFLYANAVVRYVIIACAGVFVLALIYKKRDLVKKFVKRKYKK